jgi:hypothetical protein
VDRRRGPKDGVLAPEAATVKFLRHLAAVVLVVAVIVGLGLLWAHVSGGGTGGGAVIRQAPPNLTPQQLQQIKSGAVQVPPGTDFHPSGFRLTGFQLANASNLIQTCMIEAVLAAAVITVSAIRLRHRRMRRRTAGHRAATGA